MSNRIGVKEKAKIMIEDLPKDKLEIALNFIEYLNDKEAWEETYEILNNKRLMVQLRKAQEDIKRGNWKKLENIKRNV